MPELDDFDDKYKDKPKLIVFDDFINIKTKQMVKIHKYFTAGRKFGFSLFLMAQSYIHMDKIISRSIQYYILFKLNHSVSKDIITRNHNIADIDSSFVKKAYHVCTQNPFNFFLIDMDLTFFPLKYPEVGQFQEKGPEFRNFCLNSEESHGK